MKAILIPVKEFRSAKQRLAPHFTEDERAELAAALCEDFFGVVAAIAAPVRVFVVSAEARALQWARERKWETIVETAQVSESHSVDAASRHCALLGVSALLRLPVDIPLTRASDISAILNAAEPAPSAILVPSRDGTGTNALLRSPSDLFPSHFGPGSFALHVEEARRAGASVHIIRNPRMAEDADELNDLRALSGRLRPGSATARWFNERDLAPRGG